MPSSCSAGRRSLRKRLMRACATASAWPRSTWAGLSVSSWAARPAATCTCARRCSRRPRTRTARLNCRRRSSRRSCRTAGRSSTGGRGTRRMRPRGNGSRIAGHRSGSGSDDWPAPTPRTMSGASRAMPPGSTSAPSGRPSRRVDLNSRRGLGAHPEIPSTPCSDSATACWCPSASVQRRASAWTSRWGSSIARAPGDPLSPSTLPRSYAR